MNKFKIVLLVLYFIVLEPVVAQKQANNWYFANNSALSFSATIPATLNGCASNVAGGSGTSVSGENGNLLFYSDGMTVWNSQNLVMPNGTGLAGAIAADQGALAVKQPGANKNYYLFTNSISTNTNPTGGFKYSVIDMSLVAGSGSVTSLNVSLMNPSTEKVAATRHCNGIDVWIISHESGTNNFLAYLLTAAGINTVPVISSVGPIYCNGFPCNNSGVLKFNSFGTQLVDEILDLPQASLMLYNFDKSTGMFSNPINLTPAANSGGSVEFSSNGNKLYGAYNSPIITDPAIILQWDLCSGIASSINASVDTIAVSSTSASAFYYMQLAPNGKIYISRALTSTLSVINSPNLSGAACNFVEFGQSVGTSLAKGLPGFMSNYLQQPFSYSTELNCAKASFSASLTSCAPSSSISSYYWNFGDPGSGLSNMSNIVNPTHIFSSGGIYTITSAISHNNCIADTFKVEVNISSTPQLTLTGKQTICKNETTIITASGANTFLWSTGATSPSISLSPTTTTVYSVTGTNTTNLCNSNKELTITVNPCTGIYETEKTDWLIAVYPNPHQDEPTVELKSAAQAILMDYTGRVLKQEELVSGKNTMKMDHHASGIYFLRLVSETNSITLKLVKE